FCLVLGNGIFWGRAIPFGGAPDEQDHFALVKYIAGHGRFPRYGDSPFAVGLMNQAHDHVADAGDRRSIAALAIHPQVVELRITYLFVPQLPYALNGWICRLLGSTPLPLARGVDAFWIALLAVLVFSAALASWPGRLWPAVAAGACTGLWPQISFLSAYVNDDAFALMTSGELFAAVAWCQSREF